MTDEDLPAVITLLEDALGPAPGGVDRRALFEWKHLRSPFGRSISLVAEMSGEIVGLRSFMRWKLRAPTGDDVVAVRAVDTATSPLVQRRGIFTRLTNEALDVCREQGIRFVFNTPNDKSRPGYLKMGWRVVAVWRIRLRLRRPLRVVAAAARRDLMAGPAVDPPPGPVLPFSDLPEDAVTRWTFEEPADRLHTSRTPEYLRWRYADGPIRYYALAPFDQNAGGSAGTLVVVRLRSRGRLREVVVCEALGAPGTEGVLSHSLRRLPHLAGADHAVAHAGEGWMAAEILGQAGYRRLPRAGITFTVRPITEEAPDPLDPRSWSVTLGDLEVF